MKKYIVLILAMALSLVFVAASLATTGEEPISLRKTSVFSKENVPGPVKYLGDAPGESKLIERGHGDAPPQISHLIDANMTIDLKRNGCTECHEKRKAKQKKSPPMPDSHYTDYSKKKPRVMRKYNQGRYMCTQCHVLQSDAKPLVGSTFKGTRFERK
ncbi:MAG: nitrate reductase cytochrome c-type subunit [Deltaproteobacteria bacterium]|nr:nitrate reductase cytochrome c-type subunit [Deltaproteobacteria bacterium]